MPGLQGAMLERTAVQLASLGQPIILNPFIARVFPRYRSMIWLIERDTLPMNQGSASWRRMLITSPCVLELEMHVTFAAASTGTSERVQLTTGNVSTGVTLGNLADVLGTLPESVGGYEVDLIGEEYWVRAADEVYDDFWS